MGGSAWVGEGLRYKAVAVRAEARRRREGKEVELAEGVWRAGVERGR